MAVAPLDPSTLPGTHRTRVFLGGSYADAERSLLDLIGQAVVGLGFDPIIADQFALPPPDQDIHDVTMFLLHSCRLAVFECSTLSGALMEIERFSDYGVRRALLLYQSQRKTPWPANPAGWNTSRMMMSLAREHAYRIVVRPYNRPRDAEREVRSFLRAVKRSAYGKLHSL